MQNNPVGWFEIYVKDMPRAKAFYEKVFDVSLEKLNSLNELEMWTFPMSFEHYGCSGALVKMAGFQPSGNSTLIYFSCQDCAVESKRVIKAGGMIQKEKVSIGQYGFIAIAFDTEGNMFGLHSMQ
jgi:hypothetical protein